ncbi:MotA/TolQ/ExbB proton channel family protein [Rhodohalobacter mucosus]|uniref:MotA/TolQ/ExbB proton channel domain-containing protein n=1 Tax=Rhodohalobacter mucosus TaxID=2079485 RepID=A0A316TSJ0_9BACT|nr:MotA/TolQ/ExbB proton channel family protein [Rhodohalobacter mucosus]PWN07547.1 hypothetical protein DDZ15_04640 [Rhodohalobacter mucosus]
MIQLFNAGGPVFMGIMTLILLFCFILAVMSFFMYRRGDEKKSDQFSGLLKEAGLLALVVGALGQFLGLYEAFSAIEQMGQVSQAMLMGGLKVSSITTIYGFIILVISYVMKIGLDLIRVNHVEA